MKKLTILAAFLLLGSLSPLYSQLPIQNGDVGLTCFSGEHIPLRSTPIDTNYVFGITRGQGIGQQPLGQLWRPPMIHHNDWKRSNLGEVFGLTVDTLGNYYITATSLYGDFLDDTVDGILTATGPHSPGAVYRVNGQTGAVTLFADLPNTGPALGNLDYAIDHQLFYISNFENGSIHILDRNGTQVGLYDPAASDTANKRQMILDDGAPGFAPLGERIWGIAYNINESRLYYSLWVEMSFIGDSTTANVIRSVAINRTTGMPVPATDRHEITLPEFRAGWSNPVSDIAFSQAGDRMHLSEHTMLQDYMPVEYDWVAWAHKSRVFLYEGSSSGGWNQSPATYRLGEWTEGTNASGGVDFGYRSFRGGEPVDCDSAVVMSGDNLANGGDNVPESERWVYGIQWSDWTGGGIRESVRIDADGEVSYPDKTLVGDVELFLSCGYVPPNVCDDIVVNQEDISCIIDTDGKLAYRICVQVANNSTLPMPDIALDGPQSIDQTTGDSLYATIFGGNLSAVVGANTTGPRVFGQLATPNPGPQSPANKYNTRISATPIIDVGQQGEICILVYPTLDGGGNPTIQVGDRLLLPLTYSLTDTADGAPVGNRIPCLKMLTVTVPECNRARVCCPTNIIRYALFEQDSESETGATTIKAQLTTGTVALQSVKVSLLTVTQNGEPVAGRLLSGDLAGDAGMVEVVENSMEFGRWDLCRELPIAAPLTMNFSMPEWKDPCDTTGGGARCADTLRMWLRVEATDCFCNRCEQIIPYTFTREPSTMSIDEDDKHRWEGLFRELDLSEN